MKPSNYSKDQLTLEKSKMANKLSAKNRNSTGRFVQGSSGNPNGRPVGSKNKFITLKSAFIEALKRQVEWTTWLNGQDVMRLSFTEYWQG